MLKTKRIFVVALAAFAFFASCQKEVLPPENEIPELPGEPELAGWEKLEGISGTSILSLAYEGSELLAYCNQYRYRINPENWTVSESQYGSFSSLYSSPINQEIFTRIYGSKVYVFSTANPEQKAVIDVNEIDPEFAGFWLPAGYRGKSIAMNQDNVFLTVYQRDKTDGVTIGSEPQFLMFKAIVNVNGGINISDVRTVSMEGEYFLGNVNSLHSMGELFILSLMARTYLVSPMGEWKEILKSPVYSIISYNDRQLGFGQQFVFSSVNNGENWSNIQWNAPEVHFYWSHKGFQLGDYLLITDETKAYKVKPDFSGGHIGYKEISIEDTGLSNDGFIYDQVKTESHVVIATSKGIFYRPIEAILQE